MKRVHIIGRKNHGKTTLLVELVRASVAAGLRVGTIKHTHHRHELDVEGKDSHAHRVAGAEAVAIISPSLSALFLADEATKDNRYAALLYHFRHFDLLLVEGDSSTTAPKLEVWRAERQTDPIAASDNSVLALVTDDPSPIPMRCLPRSQVASLLAWILEHIPDVTPSS